jgi:hypothetical protein
MARIRNRDFFDGISSGRSSQGIISTKVWRYNWVKSAGHDRLPNSDREQRGGGRIGENGALLAIGGADELVNCLGTAAGIGTIGPIRAEIIFPRG